MNSVNSIVLVGLGGFLGASCRYLAGKILNRYWKKSFPLATFLVNMLGSFILGIVVFHPVLDKTLQENLKYGLGIGFLGAFTTFSTFEFELLQLLENRKVFIAVLYAGLSFIIGFFAAWVALRYIKL